MGRTVDGKNGVDGRTVGTEERWTGKTVGTEERWTVERVIQPYTSIPYSLYSIPLCPILHPFPHRL